MTNIESRLNHFTNWWIFAIVLISLLLSIASLPPDIVWGDTPELTAAAWSLGIPHPTGYPLYLLLTRFAQWLPIGTIAFRANLLCAILIAFTCGVMLRLNNDLIRNCFQISLQQSYPCAFFATLSFRLTAIIWEQANISEVYAIFLFLFVITLWLIHKTWVHPAKYLPALLFIISLHILHHRLAIFLLLIALLVIVLRLKQYHKNHHYSHCALAFTLPLALLGYFPIRASWDPPINWFDPDSPQRFLDLLSGGQFSMILFQGINLLPYWFNAKSALSLMIMPLAFYSFISLFAVIGFACLLWQKKLFGVILPLLFLVYLAFFALYPVGDYMTFLLPCLILICPAIALGLAVCIHLLHQSEIKPSVIFICLIGFLGLAISPLGISINKISLIMPDRMPTMSQSTKQLDISVFQPDLKQEIPNRLSMIFDTTASEYGTEILEHIPENAMIITGLYEPTADNELNPLLYQTIVENRHPQSLLIGAGFLLYDWYRRQINHQTSLFLDMRNDQPLASREAWLEDTWQTIIQPTMIHRPVYTTSYPLPEPWHQRATITVVAQFEMNRQSVPAYYRPYLPKGYILKIEPPQPKEASAEQP